MTAVISTLDLLRSRVLKFTLQSSLLRRLYYSRAERLQGLFLLAVLLYLPLSLFFPLWVLVIGPILYGIPHIFASLRFLHYTLGPTAESKIKDTRFQSFHFLGLIWLLVTATRLLVDQNIISFPDELPSYSPEIISSIITMIGLMIIYKSDLKAMLRGALILLPLIFFTWSHPLETAGVLILLHNLIAFVYWFFSSKGATEKKVVLVSAGIFLLVNVLLFAGGFDFLYQYAAPQGVHVWAQLDYSILGHMLAPWSGNYQVWFHCVVAYAFGQAIHYFIWMKAIADEHAPTQLPTSFKMSQILWKKDLSRIALVISSIVLIAGVAMWIFVSLPMARSLYFSIAAYHGYLEISALGLLKART